MCQAPMLTGQTASWKLQQQVSCLMSPFCRHFHNQTCREAEVVRLENLIDAYANRANYVLEAAEQNINSFEAALAQQ